MGFRNDVCLLSLERPAQPQTEYMKDGMVTAILEQSPPHGTCSKYVPANTWYKSAYSAYTNLIWGSRVGMCYFQCKLCLRCMCYFKIEMWRLYKFVYGHVFTEGFMFRGTVNNTCLHHSIKYISCKTCTHINKIIFEFSNTMQNSCIWVLN